MKRITLLLTLLTGTLCGVDAAEFQSGSLYYNLLSDGNVEVAPSDGEPYTGSVAVPSEVLYNGNRRTVSGIGSHAFASSPGLEELTLPEGLTYIGDYAFYDCRSLARVSFPSTLTVISDRAFALCSDLNDIRLPAKLTKVGDNAFTRCSSLSSLGEIPAYANLEGGAFSYCSSLESIDLSEHMGSVGEGAFMGCESLKDVIFNVDMAAIPALAFADCCQLSTPVLPEALYSIGPRAFSGCPKIESVIIPASTLEIGERAFAGCSSVASITFSEDGALAIGEGAFENLPLLPGLFFTGVRSIGDRAFANASSLEWVELERAVEEIGSGAFANCESLRKIYAHSEWPAQITINTFDSSTEQTATLYVFPEACDRYTMAAYWNRFSNIEATVNFPLSVSVLQGDTEVSLENLVRVVNGVVMIDSSVGYARIFDSAGIQRFSGDAQGAGGVKLEEGIYLLHCNGKTLKLKI